ncbi:MAG TPA: thioredoxin domain-containing protein [Aggregatilinea sp.]|jgi:protein-disulfide isomerase|uniref:thioredoxin domain-containing protein n=1 Tax=Aggregatilinea sp. TaxID=2806333 RepID=UPI002BBB9806|nr:thioredoxin domain-containing protein [Aggregatilinea sp.]HML22775.1 thioredoxin domain-containing protein [Aggregatilinea sp.]
MAELTPEPIDTKRPAPVPPQNSQSNSSHILTITITALVFLLAGLLIATLLSNSGDNVSQDDLDAAVQRAVDTQVAMLQSAAPASAGDVDVQAMVDQAVSAQIAALPPAEAGSVDPAQVQAMVDPAEIQAMIDQAVGTQVAALQPSGSAGSVDAAEVQAMVDQAVGTQVAMLRPTSTPIPPTPTIIPAAYYEDDDAFQGPADAKVVIVEFADYQCTYCERWYTTTLQEILTAYPDEVKFIYRDFPIFGDDSIRAAMAAECANDQGKFWDMHNAIFDATTSEEGVTLDQATLVSFASDLDLNTDDFEACLTSEKYMSEVQSDYQAAVEFGLQGTPGFVINGVVYQIGAQPFDYFDQLIQHYLTAS